MAQAKIMVERSQRIVTPVARVSYPTLFVPRAYQEGDDPKFSATLMVKKDEAGNAFADSLKKAQDAVLKTLYPKKMPMNIERAHQGVEQIEAGSGKRRQERNHQRGRSLRRLLGQGIDPSQSLWQPAEGRSLAGIGSIPEGAR